MSEPFEPSEPAGPSGPSPSPRARFSRLFEPEMLVALSAVLVGVCALVVSTVQVKLMHEQQHASVWPRLEVMYSYNEGSLGIHVANRGVGPAAIRYVKTSVDGKPTPRWSTALAALLRTPPSPAELGWTSITDRIVPAGEDIRALHLRNREQAAVAEAQIGRLEVEICYCSIYDRCWTLDTRFTRRSTPVEAGSCPAPESTIFEN